jgi:hypothetical protein
VREGLCLVPVFSFSFLLLFHLQLRSISIPQVLGKFFYNIVWVLVIIYWVVRHSSFGFVCLFVCLLRHVFLCCPGWARTLRLKSFSYLSLPDGWDYIGICLHTWF